jgi:hypothetical protein
MPSFRYRLEMQLAIHTSSDSEQFKFSIRSPHHSRRLTVGFLFIGVPVNPTLYPHHLVVRCFAPQPTAETRSKYGPTLKASYVVLPVITSRPLRLPYARNTSLAGLIRLELHLPQLEFCGDAGISGLSSVIFHHMPPAIPRVPCRCICSFLPCKLWPSPCKKRIGVYSDAVGFIPQPDSPSDSRPANLTRLHCSLYATACGFGQLP